MIRKYFHVLMIAVVMLASCVIAFLAWPTSLTPIATHATSPIQHIIFIMKENKTFDSYFGAFTCGGNPSCVNGTTTGKVKVNGIVKTIPLAPLVDQSPHDYVHDWQDSHSDYDKGAMDAFNRGNCSASPYPCYQQATSSSIPNYWNYANNFVLNDNAWSEVEGPSFPNHMMMVSGGSGVDVTHSAINNPTNAKVGTVNYWGCDSPSNSVVQLENNTTQKPCFNGVTTLADEMTSAGVSWKYYAPQTGEPGYAWNVLDAFSQDTHGTSQYSGHDVETTQFDTDVANNTLPAMSWLIPPQKYSEHPFDGGGNDSICSGENWTVSKLNELMASPEWSSTVVVISWDEFGGFFDHVAPSNVDALGYGFRVPMLIISPFAYAANNPSNPHVEHDKVSFASVLKLAEDTFGLPSLGKRDATAGDLMTELDTSQVHNAPLPLPLRTNCPYA